MYFDIIIIGSGPGGYVAAIRASQLGMKVAVVERGELGGVCLNRGCIPTKALLKSAGVFNALKHASDYGILTSEDFRVDFSAVIQRSRETADRMSKGISFLFKKNNVEVLKGEGKVLAGKQVQVKDTDGLETIYSAKHIIIATGARSRDLPFIKQDGENVFGYYKAMTLEKQPASMIVIGSGAIGSELAYFYQSIGTQVTLIEYLPELVPLEDKDVSRQLARSFKKMKMKVMPATEVLLAEHVGGSCRVTIKNKKGEQVLEAEKVLSAVGISTNIDNLGLEETGILLEGDKIKVDEFYKTNVNGYYAIGDIVSGPALAHVASAEAISCVEKIAGLDAHPIQYNNIPSAVYTEPEIASVGQTEQQLVAEGKDLRIGKFSFTASGKAQATGKRDGFVKVIIDKNTDDILGVHMIGDHVTEMLSGIVALRKYGTKAKDVLGIIHPHPTMSEAVLEAFADAYNEAIHL